MRPMTICLFAIGLISILGQVVLLRELNVAFYGSELIYILALGMWLLWTGLGAAVGRSRHLPSLGRIRWSFLGLSLLFLLDVAFIRGIQRVFGGVPGADLPFSQQLGAIALALLPIGLLLGLQFQWAAKLFVGGSKTLAKAYGIESIGGVAGGAAATLALKVGLPNFTIAALCSLLALASAVHLTVQHGKREHPSVMLATVSAVVGLLLLAVLWQGTVIDRQLTTWNYPALLGTRDTPYGRTTVSGLFGQISVFQNGALAFESEGTSAEEFVHLAALQHPGPRAMLVLGGGVEGLLREAERHAPERIDYVDLDRRALELALAHLPGDHLESPGSIRAHIRFEDPGDISTTLQSRTISSWWGCPSRPRPRPTASIRGISSSSVPLGSHQAAYWPFACARPRISGLPSFYAARGASNGPSRRTFPRSSSYRASPTPSLLPGTA